MTAITPLTDRPAWLAQLASEVQANDQFLPYTPRSERLPRLSVRGKVFRVKLGDTEFPLTDPKTDAPLPFLPVVMIAARPGKSKAYYATAYAAGQDVTNPDCWSFDGVRPDPRVEDPQSDLCSRCPLNEFGSKISPSGKKAKACQDYKLVVVGIVRPDGSALMDVEGWRTFALKVPPTSLRLLADYTKRLSSLGVPINSVVTKLGFDPNAEYPRLTFDSMGYVSQRVFEEVTELAADDLVLAETSFEAAHTEAELDSGAKPAAKTPTEEPEPRKPAKRRTKKRAKTEKPSPEPQDSPVIEAAPEPDPSPSEATEVPTEGESEGRSEEVKIDPANVIEDILTRRGLDE